MSAQGFATSSSKEIKGGYKYEEPKAQTKTSLNFDTPELKSNTGNFELVDTIDESEDEKHITSEDYGVNGYLNHMHINYQGGDHGESYFTGPDSDITFLDIIRPMAERRYRSRALFP